MRSSARTKILESVSLPMNLRFRAMAATAPSISGIFYQALSAFAFLGAMAAAFIVAKHQ